MDGRHFAVSCQSYYYFRASKWHVHTHPLKTRDSGFYLRGLINPDSLHAELQTTLISTYYSQKYMPIPKANCACHAAKVRRDAPDDPVSSGPAPVSSTSSVGMGPAGVGLNVIARVGASPPVMGAVASEAFLDDCCCRMSAGIGATSRPSELHFSMGRVNLDDARP